MRREPDRDRTERLFTLRLVHGAGARTHARARVSPLRTVRLHPCVKFLPGILPSSVRSRRSIASFAPPPSLSLSLSLSLSPPFWPVLSGSAERRDGRRQQIAPRRRLADTRIPLPVKLLRRARRVLISSRAFSASKLRWEEARSFDGANTTADESHYRRIGIAA